MYSWEYDGVNTTIITTIATITTINHEVPIWKIDEVSRSGHCENIKFFVFLMTDWLCS